MQCSFRFQIALCLSLATFNCARPQFIEINTQPAPNFDEGFRQFCSIELANGNHERNAVLCAFYGDYRNAIAQATQRAFPAPDPFSSIQVATSDMEREVMLEKAQQLLNNPDQSEASRQMAESLLAVLSSPASVEAVFEGARPVDALEYILSRAGDYHFTLINEAHFSSQHRNFTHRLLKPLWEQGYRYLALEALGYQDSLLQERGYPVRTTGYYTNDAHFGNLIRAALQIGYTLAPYETQSPDKDGTERDRDQAQHILQRTWLKDKQGKVLVHAGYGHIRETGSSQYEPMGFQLRKMANQDILTIDQENMTPLDQADKTHPFYRFADSLFQINAPSVILNPAGQPIVEPVQQGAIDIHVYHPRTQFIDGRPDWMMQAGKAKVRIPEKLKPYEGHLIRVIRKGEGKNAVPVDQFVIDGEKVLLLPSGLYIAQIVDCEGSLVKAFEVRVGSGEAPE